MISVLVTEGDRFVAEVYGAAELRESPALLNRRQREIRRVAILIRAADRSRRKTYIFHEPCEAQ